LNTQQNVPVIDYQPLQVQEAARVGVLEPFSWLRAGFATFVELKFLAISFGLLFAIIGASISYAAANNAQLLFAFWSGFLLVAPVLAMATYHMARNRDAGQQVDLGSCSKLLRSQLGNTALLVLFLSIVMIAWIRISTLAVAVYSGGAGFNLAMGSSLLDPANLGLLATLGVVTAGFSLVIFSLLAWAMPMLSTGKHGFAVSVVSSLKAVVSQPAPMLVWGLLVASLTLLSMASFFIAFVVVFPWLGFATWEGYKRLFER